MADEKEFARVLVLLFARHGLSSVLERTALAYEVALART